MPCKLVETQHDFAVCFTLRKVCPRIWTRSDSSSDRFCWTIPTTSKPPARSTPGGPADAAVPRREAAATADYVALYRALKLDAGTATASFDLQLERLMAAARPAGIEGLGSNNWVVAGATPPPARRCWPTIRTSSSPYPRCGTSRGSRRRASRWPAPRCRGCRWWCWGRTSTSPGASPTPAPMCRTSTSSACIPPMPTRCRRPTAGRR